MLCPLPGLNSNLGVISDEHVHICFIVGEHDEHALLSWQSKKLQRVVKSTLGAETMALMTGVESCFLFNTVLSELYKTHFKLLVLFSQNGDQINLMVILKNAYFHAGYT